jgi:hypothetical protein
MNEIINTNAAIEKLFVIIYQWTIKTRPIILWKFFKNSKP